MATSFFGGSFFGGEFFNVAVTPAAADPVGGGHGKPWQQRWKQELVDLLSQDEIRPVKVPAKVRKAISRVIEAAPADDTEARQTLRAELVKLRVNYKALHLDAMRYELAKQFQAEMREAQRRLDQDDDEVITILFH